MSTKYKATTTEQAYFITITPRPRGYAQRAEILSVPANKSNKAG